jgi:hypothetical protein
MTSNDIYSVDDSVKIISGEHEGVFATITHVYPGSPHVYAVRFTREQLHDSSASVRHEHVERYRKSRYELGDVVELYATPTHEGPHESDVYNVAPVATIERVETHPHNDEWVIGYGIVERDDDEHERVERRFVKRGSVARLARSITHEQLLDAFNAVGIARLDVVDAIDAELFDDDGMPIVAYPSSDVYARLHTLLERVESALS